VQKKLDGILAILVTPFDEHLQFDEESHRSQVDFCVHAGARGVISTAVFGEFFTLTDRERSRILRVTIEAAAGRVPVIATTSGVSTAHAVELTRDACDAGVDAVMAMAPYFAQLPTSGVMEYFRHVAHASTVPVILQNAADFIGSAIAPDDLEALFNHELGLRYLKEEVPPNPHSLGAAVERLGGRVDGIFGGHGGAYMLTEHRRGATGWMPAPEFLEVTVRIADLLASGDEQAARALHARLLPGLVMERLLGIRFAKRALMRRGIIAGDHTRMPSLEFDPEDDYELDLILEGLSEYLVA
jgi:dihydrodipicolinate synthase/N-acetylneuraminate lyase